MDINNHLGRDAWPDYFHTMVGHVLSYSFSHVLIKSPKEDGPDHDGHIQTQALEEASALQGHVWGSDHQSLPGTVRKGEEIITARENQTGFISKHKLMVEWESEIDEEKFKPQISKLPFTFQLLAHALIHIIISLSQWLLKIYFYYQPTTIHINCGLNIGLSS